MKKILFVCVENAAEAKWLKLSPTSTDKANSIVSSAGINPLTK